MLALGEEAFEPRLRQRGCIGARHADDIEALLACEVDERGLDGGGVL
jgi:hypothetical protein